jgi:protein TonB
MTVGQPEPARRELAGWLGLSLLFHLALIGAVLLLARLTPSMVAQKRGEPLFVELPNVEEPAPRGNPAERSREEARPRGAPAPSRGSSGAPPAPAVKAARPAPPPPIKEMPPPEPRVASVPRPETSAPPEVPAPSERAAPLPRPEPRQAKPDAPPARPTPEAPGELPRPETHLAKPQATPAPAAPKERPALAPPPEPPRPVPDTRVARPETPVPPATKEAPSLAPEMHLATPPAAPSAPSAGAPAAPPGDRLAALRPHARGGGLRDGHGGIEGEPIPLDSKDPKFSDYFEKLRRAIKEKWAYPREAAERNIGGQLVLEFGIAKDGELRFIELRRSSGVPVLDDYAMNAVRLASPFPPIPDQMSRGGIPVMAVFNYIIDVDRSRGALNNFLR